MADVTKPAIKTGEARFNSGSRPGRHGKADLHMGSAFIANEKSRRAAIFRQLAGLAFKSWEKSLS
jgi:hypothetical protein